MIAEIMKKIAEERGISLSETELSSFSTYYEMLKDANSKMNLTRIEGEENTAYMHFLDSLAPLFLCELPQGARCLDIGAGAGFPSVPLAIARPDLQITLMDSVQKKVKFLESLSNITPNTSALHTRVEDAANMPDYRENFDYVFARAVAPLDVLCEYALPFVRTGGAFIAWKGPALAEELAQAKKAIDALGGDKNATTYSYSLMNGEYERHLLWVKKIRHTSPAFPRNPKVIRNKPIGS